MSVLLRGNQIAELKIAGKMRGICAVFKQYKHHFIYDACIASSTLA
jgi:hypothetical protein